MLREKCKRPFVTAFLLFSLTFSVCNGVSNAGVMKGNVASVRGDMIELDIGSTKGVSVGDAGRIYYTVTVGGVERPIYIAKFRITHLTEKSAMARIEERTGR